MNTATKLNIVTKLTADGLSVPDNLVLLFTPFAYHYEEGMGWFLKAAVEWQQERQRQRPYLVVALGGHVFQCGWLWSN